MYRKLITAVGAVCLIVGPLGETVWGLVSPIDEAGDARTSVASMAQHPAGAAAAVWLDLAVILLIPAALFAGRVLQAATRPLTGVGTGLLFLGSLLFTYSLGNDVVLLAASQTDGAATAAAYASSGVVALATVLGIVLQFVGVVLLGVAALRSRLIPAWAGVLLIVWNPVQVVGTIAGVKPIEALGSVLLLVAYAAVAVRLVRPAAGRPVAERSVFTPAVADH